MHSLMPYAQLSSYYYLTNCSKTYWLKTTTIFILLIDSLGQEFRQRQREWLVTTL